MEKINITHEEINEIVGEGKEDIYEYFDEKDEICREAYVVVKRKIDGKLFKFDFEKTSEEWLDCADEMYEVTATPRTITVYDYKKVE